MTGADLFWSMLLQGSICAVGTDGVEQGTIEEMGSASEMATWLKWLFAFELEQMLKVYSDGWWLSFRCLTEGDQVENSFAFYNQFEIDVALDNPTNINAE